MAGWGAHCECCPAFMCCSILRWGAARAWPLGLGLYLLRTSFPQVWGRPGGGALHTGRGQGCFLAISPSGLDPSSWLSLIASETWLRPLSGPQVQRGPPHSLPPIPLAVRHLQAVLMPTDKPLSPCLGQYVGQFYDRSHQEERVSRGLSGTFPLSCTWQGGLRVKSLAGLSQRSTGEGTHPQSPLFSPPSSTLPLNHFAPGSSSQISSSITLSHCRGPSLPMCLELAF